MEPPRGRWTVHVLASLLGAVFLSLALVVELAGSMPGDEWVLTELDEAFGTGLDDAMVTVGDATDPVPLIATSTVVVMLLAIGGRRRDVARYLAIVLVAAVGNWTLKEIFARSRPDIRPHPESVSRFSFPSGHAANTMSLWMAILLVVRTRDRRVQIAMIAAGTVGVGLVGFSRLATGVHYPSDILAGWLWVGAWSALVWSWR